MKKQGIWLIGLVLILAILINGCASTTSNATLTSDVSNLHEAVFDIEGMTCASCSIGVQAQMNRVPGVVNADVSLAEQKATLQYDADVIDTDTIAAASDVYPATLVSDTKL